MARETGAPDSGDATVERLTAFAVRMADAVRPVVRRHFRSRIAIETKADSSPVTLADREAETTARSLIAETYPDHGIVGEEFGALREDAEHVWIIDPIDGTKAFITGKPLFGTLIALQQAGVPTIGVIDMPALDERWIGTDGKPTTFNGRVATTRECPSLSAALLATTTPDMFVGENEAAFQRIRASVGACHYGGDCYNYALLASGFIDLVVEAQLQTYDFMALVPVIAGAGGIITDWQGRPLGPGSDGRVVAAGDRRIHAAAIERLNA